MDQLTQKLKDGKMKVLEVPTPTLQPGHVLVRNHYSLISAGTDTSTVKAARGSLLEKAKARPAQVKQVFDVIRSQGITQAYRAVMKKLDAWSPLGYSSAGEVVEVGEGINGFAVGDLVACGGLYASHAELVCVPANLCVKLQPDADLKQAAYNTLGAIALQGVRQADLKLGETCAVIGLGLIGQLSSLMLRASGVRVVGIDIDPAMVEMAGRHCADLALTRDAAGIEGRILQFTNGLGCDAVIITAGTASLDPINFAGAIARKKGTIVVVGAVPTGFDREPYFYRKELQVRMSCSYGPGRYDPDYEDKGIDYPPAYVRWTENRNMQAFQELVTAGKVGVSYLTTHVFKLADAPAAYDMLMSKSEPYVGIVIEYEISKDFKFLSPRINLKPNTSNLKSGAVSIGFVGAGSYAQSHLLPNIPKSVDVQLKGVMTASGTSSRSVADRFGFEFCTGDEKDIFATDEINTVFIATRHDSHAAYILKALNAGKHVFVEKPLCINELELNDIRNLYLKLNTSHLKPPILMVGYNRRFSPLAAMIRDELGGGPMAMLYRVNAGAIPPDSWIQDAAFGGGRIIGEVCHFVDLLSWMNGSLPVSVNASAMKAPGDLNDTLSISISYENGAVGTIAYFANGDKSVPKEHLEIFSRGCTGVIDDFRSAAVFARGKKKEKKLVSQDKGQKEEVRAFIDAVLKGQGAPIPFAEIYSASKVTFGIVEALRIGQAIRLDRF
jgi:predicted dehydrogenase/threonine dehydrogenase-like Zn-dependent dehydrogenase